MDVGDSFAVEPREFSDAETGRTLVQLTSGEGFDYPLYYFDPSITADGKTLVFHRHEKGEVQLYKLDLETWLATRLTNARTENALWRPYMQPPARGVRDQLSALNVVKREVVYFDGNEVRAVHVDSLRDRLLHTVAEDRTPCGLTDVSPDGRRFVFVHSDRGWWESRIARHDNPKTAPERHTAIGTRLDVLDVDSGEVRTLVRINSWLTHSNFYDNERIVFCHAPTENGVLMTDLRGGHYQHLRTQDDAGCVCHYLATAKGLMYEVSGANLGGLYNVDDHSRVEYDLGLRGYIHTGADPEGRLWFYEADGPAGEAKAIHYFPRLERGATNSAARLTSEIRTFWTGQRAHLHPRITPDRNWLLLTGGDPTRESNHLFLLDVRDLADTALDIE